MEACLVNKNSNLKVYALIQLIKYIKSTQYPLRDNIKMEESKLGDISSLGNVILALFTFNIGEKFLTGWTNLKSRCLLSKKHWVVADNKTWNVKMLLSDIKIKSLKFEGKKEGS